MRVQIYAGYEMQDFIEISIDLTCKLGRVSEGEPVKRFFLFAAHLAKVSALPTPPGECSRGSSEGRSESSSVRVPTTGLQVFLREKQKFKRRAAFQMFSIFSQAQNRRPRHIHPQDRLLFV